MMSKINHLFDGLKEMSQDKPDKYCLGEIPTFAQQANYRGSTLFIIISLYCAVCIDLLPSLVTVNDVFDGKIVLVIDGDMDEVQIIKTHFNFPFDVISASPEDFYYIYRPELTPYAYILNNEQKITYMGHVGEVMTKKGTIAQLGFIPLIEEAPKP